MRHTVKTSLDDLEWLYVPDIVYAEYGNIKRHLNMIVPFRWNWKEDTRYPLILFIKGSAWYKQELYNDIPALSMLARRGFVIALEEYRESDIAKFPAQLDDTDNALKFLVSKAKGFHIDTDNIFLMGNSSGAHIALISAMKGAAHKIRGVIAESAPSDMYICKSTPIPDYLPEDFNPVSDLLGISELSENEELSLSACCKTYIAPERDIPPILLIHGTEDEQVDVYQSRLLYDKLTEQGHPVELIELEGAHHGGAPFWTEEVLDIINSFIKSESGY